MSANEPNLRDFFDNEEDYRRAAADPEKYIADQLKEIRLGAERLEASNADSAKTDSGKRRKTVSGKEIPHMAGRADGVSVKDFALLAKARNEPKKKAKSSGYAFMS